MEFAKSGDGSSSSFPDDRGEDDADVEPSSLDDDRPLPTAYRTKSQPVARSNIHTAATIGVETMPGLFKFVGLLRRPCSWP
jgi:hypothetical protein